MADKPQLKTGKLPTEPDPIQRWIPGWELVGLTPGQHLERLEHLFDQILAAVGQSGLEGGFGIGGTEILEQGPAG